MKMKISVLQIKQNISHLKEIKVVIVKLVLQKFSYVTKVTCYYNITNCYKCRFMEKLRKKNKVPKTTFALRLKATQVTSPNCLFQSKDIFHHIFLYAGTDFVVITYLKMQKKKKTVPK